MRHLQRDLLSYLLPKLNVLFSMVLRWCQRRLKSALVRRRSFLGRAFVAALALSLGLIVTKVLEVLREFLVVHVGCVAAWRTTHISGVNEGGLRLGRINGCA